MARRSLTGVAAAPGVAAGRSWLHSEPDAGGTTDDPEHEIGVATRALAGAAEELETQAADLVAGEAEIVAAGALMASDPALLGAVVDLIETRHFTASRAIVAGASRFADSIAAIGDEALAARADDVRAMARRAARIASGQADILAEIDGDIVIARDLGPAEIAQIGSTPGRAVALAAGGPTAHAAIVARSLGVALVVGLGDEVFDYADADVVIVDGSAGTIVREPGNAELRAAAETASRREAERERIAAEREAPAQTSDGHRIVVLTNAAGPVEVAAGVEAGAEGIGLLRTELAFLESERWPTRADHTSLLEQCAAAAPGMPLTVRLMDFGGDKTPPFLSGEQRRGIALLLGHPHALFDQLAAVGQLADAGVDLRVLLPLAEQPGQVHGVRAALDVDLPLGAMIETRSAVNGVAALAEACEFLSIGTNDLAHDLLGSDRFSTARAPAFHPDVLREIATVVAAAHSAGLTLEVCGEAASDPVAMPLLVGLGIDELSAGAARVGAVRRWTRALDYAKLAVVARAALALDDDVAVADLVADQLGTRLDE